MAVEVGTAYLAILPSAKGFGRKLEAQVGGQTRSSGQKAGKAYGGGLVAGAAKFAGPLAAAFAGVKILGGLKESITLASDLGEAGTKTNQIFGRDGAKALDKFAKGSAKRLGQTKLEILNAAGSFGTFGKAAGLSGKDLVKFSTGFSSLSTDMASFFNTSPEEAMQAISSGLRGEAEPLRKYGVLLDDASMRQEALKQGLIKTTKQALTPQQKVLAAQALIYKQTKDAQGDFARTSGGLANQQRILSAQWKESKTRLGQALLPAMTTAVTLINDRFFPAMDNIRGIFGQFAGPLIKGASGALKMFLGALRSGKTEDEGTWIESIALGIRNLIPIGKAAAEGVKMFVNALRTGKTEDEGTKVELFALKLRALGEIVVARVVPAVKAFAGFIKTTVIPALVAVGGFIVANVIPAFVTFGNFIATQIVPRLIGIGSAIKGLVSVVLPIIVQIFGELRARIIQNLPAIQSAFNSIRTIVRDVFTFVGWIITTRLDFVKKAIQTVTAVISFIWKRWGGQITALVGNAFGTVIKIISGALKVASGVIKVITGVMMGDWKKAGNGLKLITEGLRRILIAIFNGIRTQLQIILGGLISNLRSKWTGFLSWSGSTLKNGLARVKEFVLAPVRGARDAVGTLLGQVRDKFKTGVTNIGKAWDGLKAKAKAPISFMINTVLNGGLIKAFNWVAGKVGVKSMGNLKIKGFDRGGWTGPGSRMEPAGIVHADEFVVKKPSRRKVERKHPGLLDYLNAHGTLPGFFLGGRVPAPGPRNRHGGYGWARWAGDIPAGHGTPVKAWKAGVVAAVKHLTTSYGKHVRINHGGEQTLYAHLSKIAVSAGQRVAAGQTIGRVGSTGNSSGPHLHFEVSGGSAKGNNGKADSGDSGSGSFVVKTINWVKRFTDRLKGPIDKIKDIGSTEWAGLPKGAARKLADGMVDKVKSAPNAIQTIVSGVTGKVGEFVGKVTGRGFGGAKALARKMGASPVSNHTDPQGDRAFDAMIGIAGGKRLVGALLSNRGKFGIKYLIHNMRIWSARNWGGRRYSPISGSGDYRHTRHVHASFYAKGTGSAKPGLAWVGERGPELVNFKGGERVYKAQDSARMTSAADSGGDLHIHGAVFGDADEFARAVARERDAAARRARLRANFRPS